MRFSIRIFRSLINISKRQNSFSCVSKTFTPCASSSKRYHAPNFRQFTCSHLLRCSDAAYEHSPGSPENKALGKITPKLFLAFTCKMCNARIEKHISKIAYTKGVVIVRCDKCEENHLIADNLGWFPNLKSMRNIEDIMASKGEVVKKTPDGYQIKEE